MDKTFDYLVRPQWADRVAMGSIVRVELHGRRTSAWVVGVDVEPPPGVELRSVTKLSSVGPPSEVIDLAHWAALRWSGRVSKILRAASPPRHQQAFAAPRQVAKRSGVPVATPQGLELIEPTLARAGVSLVTTGPADTQLDLVAAVAAVLVQPTAELGLSVLIVAPSVARARWMSGQLRQLGHRVHLHPESWASGTAGGIIIGARSAVWAPTGPLAAVVVLDEHDEALQEERNPTWHARDVAIERARRAEVPCVLISPSPTAVSMARADHVATSSRRSQRQGWPVVEVIDRRDDEPGRGGLFSSRLSDALRHSDRAVAVLNRKGRAVMLACSACGELVRTEDGIHLMVESDGGLEAPATGEQRPMICANCGSTALKRLRLGVGRAREELASLLNREVVEWSSSQAKDTPVDIPDGLAIGTEAALHGASRIGFRPEVVAFLDFDQELHAPRYRAAEQAMGLLVRAARLIGGRRPDRRILVQTRTPDHRVLRAAVAADPALMFDEELALRRGLGFPPAGALAEVSGVGAGEFLEPLLLGADPSSVGETQVLGPRPDGRYLLRAQDADSLAQVLDRLPGSRQQVRVAVDPPRV